MKEVKAVEKQPAAEGESEQVDLLKIYGCRTSAITVVDGEKAGYMSIYPLVTLRVVLNLTLLLMSVIRYQNACIVNSVLTLRSCRQQTLSNLITRLHSNLWAPLGKISVWCNSHRLDFLIMPDDEENLLGFQTCRSIGLIQRVSLLSPCLTRDRVSLKLTLIRSRVLAKFLA